MSYKTYTTEALVCGSYNSNTSDKSYLLFTQESGMLFATARSAREERSKQRCALQDFSYIRVSLVKGKSGWRIGSTEALGNPFLHAENRTQRALVNYILAQLRRFVHGEVPLQRTYSDVAEILQSCTVLENENVRVERLFLLRLLFDLGYIAPDQTWLELVAAPTIAQALAYPDTSIEEVVLQALHTGTQASHL
jgi:recombinational DNA repair protein (RecF pathway)